MRPTYLALSIVLGVVFSYGLHAVTEILYLRWAETRSLEVVWYTHFGKGLCALHPIVQYGLLLFGVIGGWLVGRVWWRLVYVERRWSKP